MSDGKLHVIDSRTSLKYEIPIHRNTIKATDFQSIKGHDAGSNSTDQVANGLRLYDPGLKNTAVLESKITFIDASRGIVQHRGYNVADFWRTADFEDLTHLLVWGHWPSSKEKEALQRSLFSAIQSVSEHVFRVIQAFPQSASPMQMVIAGLAAHVADSPQDVPAYATRNIYHGNMPAVDKAIIQTLATFQVCVGLAACHRAGIPFTPPNADDSFLSNLLTMMGKVNKTTKKPDGTTIHHIQRMWANSADLGHTNSTSAILLAASSFSDPVSCLITALSTGHGILHFGAAEASIRSLEAIGCKDNVPAFLAKVKRKEDKLWGYGHRMFKIIDPRIPVGAQIAKEIDPPHPLLEVAMELDRTACEDEYFVSRGLQANGDLYVGALYAALGFEADFVPVMISLMRSGGLMAHWREAMSQPNAIWHAQQFYTGEISSPPTYSLQALESEWKSTRAAGDIRGISKL